MFIRIESRNENTSYTNKYYRSLPVYLKLNETNFAF